MRFYVLVSEIDIRGKNYENPNYKIGWRQQHVCGSVDGRLLGTGGVALPCVTEPLLPDVKILSGPLAAVR